MVSSNELGILNKAKTFIIEVTLLVIKTEWITVSNKECNICKIMELINRVSYNISRLIEFITELI